MAQPQINVDHFHHRPTYNVVGLLTDKSQIPAISSDLRSAGVDVAAAEILCGEQGTRILDADGRYHGLRGRVVRTLQRLGYDGTTLAIYDEALRDGDLVLHVPARSSSSPSSMRADPDPRRTSRPLRRLVRLGPRAVPAARPSEAALAIHQRAWRVSGVE